MTSKSPSSDHYQNLYLITQLGGSVRAAFSGRSVGRKNFAGFVEGLDIPESRVKFVSQVHGADIVAVRDPNLETRQLQADALMTNIPGVALCIRTADCLPVFIASEDPVTIALIHCGWRSLQKKILERVIDLFWRDYGVRSSSLKVFLGPCIKRCCYTVGKEFEGYFSRQFLIPNGEAGYRFDLAGEALKRIWEKGVPAEQYHDSGFCTSCQNDQFYSARKEKTDERIFSILQIPV